MPRLKSLFRLALLALLAGAGGFTPSRPASAQIIETQLTGNADGSIGSQSFTNTPITIDLFWATSTLLGSPGGTQTMDPACAVYTCTPEIQGSVSVAGLGNFIFAGIQGSSLIPDCGSGATGYEGRLYVDHPAASASVTRYCNGTAFGDIFAFTGTALTDWDLTSPLPLSPITFTSIDTSGVTVCPAADPYCETWQPLDISSVDASIQAFVVPEPSSAPLLAAGLCLLALGAHWRAAARSHQHPRATDQAGAHHRCGHPHFVPTARKMLDGWQRLDGRSVQGGSAAAAG
jgi:hypothetical protein